MCVIIDTMIKWTEKEFNVLRTNYATFGAKVCAKILNRPIHSVHTYAIKIGLRRWKEKEGEKTCSICQKSKPLNEFNPNTWGRLNVSSDCKICHNQKMRNEYQKNINLSRKKNNTYAKQRRKIDINTKLIESCRTRIIAALRGKNKSNHTLNLLGCSIIDLKNHLEKQFQQGMSWDNYGFFGWHIDHIRPCSDFDFSQSQGQKECFHYTNLQPLWAKDNLSKNNKLNWRKN